MDDLRTRVTGVIGMACGDASRYSESYASLMGIVKPPGTVFFQVTGMSVADNFNKIARETLQSSAEWLFLTNDDQLWPPNILTKLLQHDVDIVTDLYLSRA